MKSKQTIQIVEDDSYIRKRLVEAIGHDTSLVVLSAVATFAEAKQALVTLPDIFLVDLGLPDGNGADLIRIATRQSEGMTKSIVFSVFGDERRVIQAIEAGASGYLLKDTPISALPSSIIELAEGKSPMSPAIAIHLLKRFQAPVDRGSHDVKQLDLTRREVEVLQYISQGHSAKGIAVILQVSYHTVVSHTKRIYKKLNVNSRTAAVFEAKQSGIIYDQE